MKCKPNDAVIVRNVSIRSGEWHGYGGLAFVVDIVRGNAINWYIVLLDNGTLARAVSGDMKHI